MTLQQLKYVVTIARTGTIKEAANELYIVKSFGGVKPKENAAQMLGELE